MDITIDNRFAIIAPEWNSTACLFISFTVAIPVFFCDKFLKIDCKSCNASLMSKVECV